MWKKFRKDLERNKKENPLHHRNGEIDFVLEYLPDLSWLTNKNVSVLDIGSTESLLIFELKKRGYITMGMDIRPYDNQLPADIGFYKGDITEQSTLEFFKSIGHPYYIVALSTIEHIGLPCYGSKIIQNGDRLAIENIHKLLHDNGYFLITIPMKHWQSDSGRGYTYKEFIKLLEGLFVIFSITQRGGQICACLTKC